MGHLPFRVPADKQRSARQNRKIAARLLFKESLALTGRLKDD
jgi:hypothetical protein